MDISNVKGQSKDHLEHIYVLHYGPWINIPWDPIKKFPFKDQRIKVAKKGVTCLSLPADLGQQSPRNLVLPGNIPLPKHPIALVDEFQWQAQTVLAQAS